MSRSTWLFMVSGLSLALYIGCRFHDRQPVETLGCTIYQQPIGEVRSLPEVRDDRALVHVIRTDGPDEAQEELRLLPGEEGTIHPGSVLQMYHRDGWPVFTVCSTNNPDRIDGIPRPIQNGKRYVLRVQMQDRESASPTIKEIEPEQEKKFLEINQEPYSVKDVYALVH